MRALLAYAVAPLTSALIMFGWSLLTSGDTSAPNGPSYTPVLVASIVVSYAWTGLVGVPAHIWLTRRDLIMIWHYAAAGLVLAVIPIGLHLLYVIVYEGSRSGLVDATSRNAGAYAKVASLFGLCGVFVAAVFWALAVRGLNVPSNRRLKPTPTGASAH